MSLASAPAPVFVGQSIAHNGLCVCVRALSITKSINFMTVNFLIRWARKWRTIAASIPSNDKRFDRAIKNLRWINIQLSEMEATLRKNKRGGSF
jgi:riboflavin synthase alpha subunit